MKDSVTRVNMKNLRLSEQSGVFATIIMENVAYYMLMSIKEILEKNSDVISSINASAKTLRNVKTLAVSPLNVYNISQGCTKVYQIQILLRLHPPHTHPPPYPN